MNQLKGMNSGERKSPQNRARRSLNQPSTNRQRKPPMPRDDSSAARNAASKIRFNATLFRPVATANPRKAVSWTFLNLPQEASAKLPARGMVSVEGTLNGSPFQATLDPDGKGGHWLKVDQKLREAAGTEAGDVVRLEIRPMREGSGRKMTGN